jgi:pyrimidine-specific ribonucleoside hydrolase
MLVGRSSQLGGVPVVLLGGRFYTGKKVYAYTDFGGGVEHKKGETPQQGAFREFAEELFGYNEEIAKAEASRLCAATTSALIGGRPFVHNGYAIFIVPAEAIVESTSMSLPVSSESVSAIDQLFAAAKRNSELTSVALVSIAELLQAAGIDSTGMVSPLSVRQLDGEERESDKILLRNLMVGTGGSINKIRDLLEGFDDLPAVGTERCQVRSGTDELLQDPSSSCQGDQPEGHDVPPGMARCKRWRASRADLAESGNSETSTQNKRAMPYVFDMETGDPDDILTLLFLGAHPEVQLRAVTITPGTKEQVALVQWLLEQMDLSHVRLGAQEWPTNGDKPVPLNAQFYQSFGRSPAGKLRCERADQVLVDCCDETVTLVTGGPLHNLAAALQMDGFQLGRWVAQGGFAGEGVVPAEKQMDKFKGLEVCPTWNFGGNIPAAQAALSSLAIAKKICVSKNVCHSVNYDMQWHEALGAAAQAEARNAPKARPAVALGMMHEAMDAYLRHKPGGKKLHDPLALAVALEESVCELAEVQLFCQKGKWGSRLSPGSNIWISVAYDAVKFQATLLPCSRSSAAADQTYCNVTSNLAAPTEPQANTTECKDANKRWQKKNHRSAQRETNKQKCQVRNMFLQKNIANVT